MKTFTFAAVLFGLLSVPAFAQHPTQSGASDPATPRIAVIAANTHSDDSYGPGYAAPVRDGWG